MSALRAPEVSTILKPEGTAEKVATLSLFSSNCDQVDFFLGTFAPLFLASDKPIAMACLRLVTRPPLPPLPDRSVPAFSLRIARSTLLPAAFPYLGIFFLRDNKTLPASDAGQKLDCFSRRKAMGK